MAPHIKCFPHYISMGAYPRAKLSLNWYGHIYKKISTLTSKGPMPKDFFDKNELEALEDSTKLPDVLTVNVIGKTDFNDEQLKATLKYEDLPKEQTKGMSATGLAIYICNLRILDLDIKRFQKKVTKTLDFLSSHNKTNERIQDSLLIVFEFGDKIKPTASDYEDFVAASQARAESVFGTELPSSSFISVTDEIGNSITQWIESMYVTEKLERMQSRLQRFVYYYKNKRLENTNIAASEEFRTALNDFLTNGHAFADMMEDAGTLPFIDLLLKYLKQVARCNLVKLISTKYGFPESMCNTLAHEYSLEEKLTNEVSHNTKYSLNKMETDCQAAYDANKDNDKYYTFPKKHERLASYIIHDMEKVVAEFEESVCMPVKKIATNLGKLKFEIGALQQRIEQKISLATHVVYDIFKELSTLDYFFGVGTIYGVVEIHVVGCDVSKAEEDIADIFEQIQYRGLYRIRSVVGMPKPLFHQGAALRSNATVTNETLGCFLTPENGTDLYAITCAHIFPNQPGPCQVSVVTNGGLTPFATSPPNLRIPGIDFAALKVNEEVKAHCNPMLKDEDRIPRNGMFSQQEVPDGSPVYMYGARSNFSRGSVKCSNYYKKDAAREEEKMVLIEPEYTGEENASYATSGDSGAVNCMTIIEGQEVFVQAVSVVSNGGLRLEGETNETCVSFPFALPLREISRTENMNLGFARR